MNATNDGDSRNFAGETLIAFETAVETVKTSAPPVVSAEPFWFSRGVAVNAQRTRRNKTINSVTCPIFRIGTFAPPKYFSVTLPEYGCCEKAKMTAIHTTTHNHRTSLLGIAIHFLRFRPRRCARSRDARMILHRESPHPFLRDG